MPGTAAGADPIDRQTVDRAVTALRQRVWGRPTTTTPPVPAGSAFAAYALGFLTGGPVRVFAHGRWTGVATDAGHVLVR